jgi:hypothetical protein
MAKPESINAILDISRTYFKRDLGDAALTYWADQLESGKSIDAIRGYMLYTPEGQTKARDRVKELYKENLGRDADPAGLDYWARQMIEGNFTIERVQTELAQSEEGRNYAMGIMANPTGQIPGGVASGGDTINAPQTPVPVSPPAPSTASLAQVRRLLGEFGLDEMYDDIANAITDDTTDDELDLLLRDNPVYRQRFSVIFDREAKGMAPVSAAEVMSYEKYLGQLTSQYGYPINPGDSIQSLAGRLLGSDVSLNEVTERLTAQRSFARQVLEDPNQDQEAVAALLGQGFTLYDVAEMALDPSKTLDQVQRRLEAAAVANEAGKAKYRLTADEATDLARQGLTGDQAREGFTSLAVQSQVVNALGAEADPVSRQQELAALTGDQTAIAAIETSRRNRVAANAESGGFATTKEGFGGLR